MSTFSDAVFGVAALGLVAVVGGAAVTQPDSARSPAVDPTALIVVGSSTNPTGSGNQDFFGGMFNQSPYNPGGLPGPDLIDVNFFGGTAAIRTALLGQPDESNAVLSSGWGAANASLVLSRLDRDQNPVVPNTLFVLDNNVSRPDGGFGTRYPLFALIGVNPFPSPIDTAAPAVVDIAYQYNYNSNAPADLLNIVAHVNSLVAYLYGYREQSEIDLPVDVDGRPTVDCGANTCAVLAGGADAVACPDARCDLPAGDRVLAYVTTRGNTTYVTYTTDELPLARLIRDIVPFGNVIADLSEPLLKVIVDSAYYGGNPIPSDPSRYRPARLMPSLGELADTAAKVPVAIREGLESLSDKETEDRSVFQRHESRPPAVAPAAPARNESPEAIEEDAEADIAAEQPDLDDVNTTTVVPQDDSKTETSAGDDADSNTGTGARDRRRDAMPGGVTSNPVD